MRDVDLWNPPEDGITDTEEEKWESEHRTQANLNSLAEQIADPFFGDSTVYNLIEKAMLKGLEQFDNQEVAILFNYFTIAPTIESYVESLRDSDDPQLD